ncbi:hypothetical protein M0R45_036319 [Rubus argutus]|uniref:Uncharacterized protein n=1 Tax=Rubus argutus TaxID=59490 RepID=A0AAW1W045_RUBAR
MTSSVPCQTLELSKPFSPWSVYVRGDTFIGGSDGSSVYEKLSTALTALAFGLACKQINIGGHKGWRLRVVEVFIIILTFTERPNLCTSCYPMLVSSAASIAQVTPDTDYPAAGGVDPIHKGRVGVPASRVV